MASGGGLSRRRFLGVTAAAGMVLAGCTRSANQTPQPDPVAVAESRRPHSGRTVSATLTAQRTRADLGGVIA
ncbi:twin-arginine translocation signal domain-containing protein, partial [Mycolicibacterium gilvum]|nr:twin-arginine translocation signal domain-containing protein [Mycolicibacterium gilvum]